LGERNGAAQLGEELDLERLGDLLRHVAVVALRLILDRLADPERQEQPEPGEQHRGQRDAEAAEEQRAPTEPAGHGGVSLAPRPPRGQGGGTRRAGPVGSRPRASKRRDQLLVRADISDAVAISWRRWTITGSLDVMSVRQPPSMFTTSRLSFPLAAAPR